MESDAEEQLRIIERAEAAPYISYPKSPWWYPPVAGLWVAALIGAFTWWRDSSLLFVLAGAVTAFALVTAGIWYYERRYAVAAAKVRERLG